MNNKINPNNKISVDNSPYKEEYQALEIKLELISEDKKVINLLYIDQLKNRGFLQRINRKHEANFSDLMTQLKNISKTDDDDLHMNHL